MPNVILSIPYPSLLLIDNNTTAIKTILVLLAQPFTHYMRFSEVGLVKVTHMHRQQLGGLLKWVRMLNFEVFVTLHRIMYQGVQNLVLFTVCHKKLSSVNTNASLIRPSSCVVVLSGSGQWDRLWLQHYCITETYTNFLTYCLKGGLADNPGGWKISWTNKYINVVIIHYIKNKCISKYIYNNCFCKSHIIIF